MIRNDEMIYATTSMSLVNIMVDKRNESQKFIIVSFCLYSMSKIGIIYSDRKLLR